MTGRVIAQIFPEIRSNPGEMLLDVQDISTANGTVSEVSIQVRAGEVVGLAGLVGSGKSEVARACFGVEKLSAGRVAFRRRGCHGPQAAAPCSTGASSICRRTGAARGW